MGSRNGRAVLLALAVALAAGAAACEGVRTMSFDEEDGIAPLWYEATYDGLPPTFAPEDWPDGVLDLRLPSLQEVRIETRTRADGGREVLLTTRALLLDAPLSTAYRDFFGEDKIRGTRAIRLELEQLDVDVNDAGRLGDFELGVAGASFSGTGDEIELPDEEFFALREKLLAGEEIQVPVSWSFHLSGDTLDALGPKLHFFVMVQPTIVVDILDAL